jgi:acyl carrier protein
MATITERVAEVIIAQLGVEASEITADASFTNDLGADSLDTVELIMGFEKEFGINITDEESEVIQTVGDVIKFLESKGA